MNTIEKILELMQENNINAVALEKELNFKGSLITHWKAGRANPSAEALKKIADFFNVSTDYLLGRTEIKKPTLENVDFAEFINILYEKNMTKKSITNLSKEQLSTIADIIKNFNN